LAGASSRRALRGKVRVRNRTKVQEVAVKAIEGSANAKLSGNLQQLLSEQGRKSGGEK
jgi:hypothetical protein